MDNDRSRLLTMRYKLTLLISRVYRHCFDLFEVGCFRKCKHIFEICPFCSSLLTCCRVSLLTGLISSLMKYRLICLVQVFSGSVCFLFIRSFFIVDIVLWSLLIFAIIWFVCLSCRVPS